MLPRSKGLRVRIDASLDVRIRNFAERYRLSWAEAARKVEETDRIREEFLRNHFPQGSDVATRFDLVVNTSSLSVEQTSELLVAALGVRGLIGA
jgi:cytidylate kinase